MIELQKSRTDKSILSYNSKLLCSKVDPIREATKWLDSHVNFIVGSDVLFVMGLGSTYHIESLCRKFPNKKIVVIEREQEIIEAAEKYFSDVLFNICVVHCSDASKLFEIKEISSNLVHKYSVLMFGPAQSPDKKFYIEIQSRLLGREQEHFKNLLQFKKSWANLFKRTNGLSLVDESPLTIKDLKQRMDNEPNRKQFIINALNELVL